MEDSKSQGRGESEGMAMKFQEDPEVRPSLFEGGLSRGRCFKFLFGWTYPEPPHVVPP